jgi:hypothetical protein
MKAYYYYMQYLDQALFPQLALLAVACVSVIYKEFCQWLKYIHLLYNSIAEKLLVKPGIKEQIVHHNMPQELADLSLHTTFTSNSNRPKSGNPHKHSSKQLSKKSHASKDEIDGIFDLF